LHFRTETRDAGSALMGIGRATGENRAVEAAKLAINSPLLELSIDGAKGVLFNIAGGPDMTMSEINEAAEVITESIDKDAKVIFGAVVDNSFKKGEFKVTVIATGFDAQQSVKKEEIKQPIKIQEEAEPIRQAQTVQTEEKKPLFRPFRTDSIEIESDGMLDIPAFIRKKMK